MVFQMKSSVSESPLQATWCIIDFKFSQVWHRALKNYLACMCAYEVNQLILFSSQKWSSINSSVGYVPHSKDRKLPLCTAFRQCICKVSTELSPTQRRLKTSKNIPTYHDSHSRQLTSVPGMLETSLLHLNNFVGQVGGRRGTALTYFGSGMSG